MSNNTSGSYNTAFGSSALQSNTTAGGNTAMGWVSLQSNTTGGGNTAFGSSSLKTNSTGFFNTAIGIDALENSTTGESNTVAGHDVMRYNISGSYNTAIGEYVFDNNTTGNFNTGIGHNADLAANNLTNATAIGAYAFVGTSNSMVLGSIGGVNGASDTIKVGIGTTIPAERLEVVGKTKTSDFQMTNGANLGYVLSSDASGNASWINSTALSVTENDPKIGSLTSARIPKWNGTKLVDGNITDSGTNVGIGTVNPMAKLEVAGGDALINGLTVGLGNGAVGTNTAHGYQALFSNTTGSENSAQGYKALYSNISGISNTAMGNYALLSNTIGNYNTATGDAALLSNTDGVANTAIGRNALYSNTSGSFNSANSMEALHSNYNGNENTATGYASLYYNTIGSGNNAIGAYALFNNISGNSNVALGTRALYSNNAGFNLVAIGDSALFNNTGFSNTAVGSKTLYSNTSGAYNTAEGYQALYSNTTGVGNTATGPNLNNNTTGSFNTATGLSALGVNSTGSNNTATGSYALYTNESGSGNTAIGRETLWSINGSYHTGIGSYANGLSNISNATVIGAGAYIDASNKVRIGNTSVTSIEGQVGWSTPSDVRIKDNIKENVPGLIFIKALRPVTFHFNFGKQVSIMDMQDTMQWQGKYDIEKITFSGFNAQDVDAAAKKINYDFSGVDKSGKIMGLRYAEFVVPLVKAVQELSNQNDSLLAINKNLESRLEKLERLVDNIQQCNPCSNTTVSAPVDSYTTKIGDQAVLEQNIPNPFSNTTVINYTLPQKFTAAQMVITDKNGKILKQVIISGSGKGMLKVDASTLASGAYQYSLIIDGKLIATKQMLLAK